MENTLIFIFQVEKHNVKKNLGEYTTILDPYYFLEYTRIINPAKKRRLLLELTNGIILPVAKRRQEGFNKFIKLRD
jgi:hypothetical protein